VAAAPWVLGLLLSVPFCLEIYPIGASSFSWNTIILVLKVRGITKELQFQICVLIAIHRIHGYSITNGVILGKRPIGAYCPYCRLSLAIRTVKTRTLPLRNMNDGYTAFPAWLPGSSIHPVLLLKVARMAFAVDKITQAAPARLNCSIERFLYRLHEPFISR